MFVARCLLAAMVLSLGATNNCVFAAVPFKAADYPTVSKRAAFFEERINAKNPETRYQVLQDVSYSYLVADADYVAFLKRLLRDADLRTRSEALKLLYVLWVPLEPAELPRQFEVGYGPLAINLDDPATIPDLIHKCAHGSSYMEEVIEVVGLLRLKAAIPALKQRTTDEAFLNRYHAARALYACGDRESARAVIADLVREQLRMYSNPMPPKPEKPDPTAQMIHYPGIVAVPRTVDPYYAIAACQAMVELSPQDKPKGLEKLITLLSYLEHSRDINHVSVVLELLSNSVGEYFTSPADVRQWYAATYGKGKATRPAKIPPAIKATDYPSVAPRAAFFEARINAADAEKRRILLAEIAKCAWQPDAEYVALLKRLLNDPSPRVRGQALLTLDGFGIHIDPKDMPRQFIGSTAQLIDRDNPSTIPDLIRICESSSDQAGYAAEILGVLRERSSLPALRKLARRGHIFSRFDAAVALLKCGDQDSARTTLAGIIRSQLALYADPPPPPPSEGKHGDPPRPMSPWIALLACREFAEIGAEEKRVGLDQAITLLDFLERSEDGDDHRAISDAKQMLGVVIGKYFDSAAELRQWYKEQYPSNKQR